MRKGFRTLSVALLLCAVFALSACSGSASLSGNYDKIVSLNGYNTIAYKDGAQRVFKNGRATGDKAFSIAVSIEQGDFFIAQKTADSGYGLMNAKGKFISDFTDVKLNDIYGNTVYWFEKDKKDVYRQKYEVNYFVAVLDLSDETDTLIKTNNKAIMTTNGEILPGRYSWIATDNARIIQAEKLEQAEGGTATYTYALKADGTQIGRKVLNSSDMQIVTSYATGSSVASIKKETAPDGSGNSYDVYKADGAKISDAYSHVANINSAAEALGLFKFTKKVGDDVNTYYIKRDCAIEEHNNISAIYEYNGKFYIIEGAEGAVKLKTADESTFAISDVTGNYKGISVYTNYLRGETADGKYDYMLSDGSAIASGVPKDNELFNITMYNRYENSFGYILRNGNALESRIAGGEKVTKTLGEGETASVSLASSSNGYAVISKSGADGYTKLWLPHTDKTVDITGNPTISGNVLSITVKKDGKEYYYRSLARNIKYWDGDLLNGNLLCEAGGIASEAELETGKFVSAPSASFSLNTTMAHHLPKMKSYANAYANYVEKQNAIAKIPREISGGSLRYTLKRENPSDQKEDVYYFLAYGFNDSYTKYNVKALGKDEGFNEAEGPLAVTRSKKTNYGHMSNVYKIEVGKKGVLELKEVVKGLRYATISTDNLYNRYIWAQAADGTDEIYSEKGKLMLRGGLFYAVEIQNYTAAVTTDAGGYGIIKLKENGGFKALKDLDWYNYSLFWDGSFLVQANQEINYAQLCNGSGKVLEKSAAISSHEGEIRLVGEVLNTYDYNYFRIYEDGKKDFIMQYEVRSAAGKSKIFTITIKESSLDYAIQYFVD